MFFFNGQELFVIEQDSSTKGFGPSKFPHASSDNRCSSLTCGNVLWFRIHHPPEFFVKGVAAILDTDRHGTIGPVIIHVHCWIVTLVVLQWAWRRCRCHSQWNEMQCNEWGEANEPNGSRFDNHNVLEKKMNEPSSFSIPPKKWQCWQWQEPFELVANARHARKRLNSATPQLSQARSFSFFQSCMVSLSSPTIPKDCTAISSYIQ